MKYSENKFQESVIKHLLKLGATFEPYANVGFKAKLNGAEFTFFELKANERTDVHFVACRNTEGNKQNFTSIYSRAESLDLFKIHVAELFGSIQHFGYFGQSQESVKVKSGFWSYSSANTAMKQSKLKNARLYLMTEQGERVVIS